VVERLVYGAPEVGEFLTEARTRLGGGARVDAFLAELESAVVGKVWSARVVGRKPEIAVPDPLANEIELGPARPTTSRIAALLDATGLPAGHIEEHLNGFIVARSGEHPVGCVAVESYGEEALLRSLAVTPPAGVGEPPGTWRAPPWRSPVRGERVAPCCSPRRCRSGPAARVPRGPARVRH